MKVHLATCVGLKFDKKFLPHFVPYYRARGVDHFHIILQHPKRTFVPGCLVGCDDVVVSSWVGKFNPGTKVRKMSAALQLAGEPGDLFVTVDVDEFAQIDDVRKTWEEYAAPCVYGRFIDRFAVTAGVTGPLSTSGDIFEQFPVCSTKYSRKVIGASTFKPIIQPYGRYRNIHQFPACRYARWKKKWKPVRLHHFKWHHERLDKSRSRTTESSNAEKRGRVARKILRKVERGE